MINKINIKFCVYSMLLLNLMISCNLESSYHHDNKLKEHFGKFKIEHTDHFPKSGDYKIIHYSFLNALPEFKDNKGTYLKIWYKIPSDKLQQLHNELIMDGAIITKHSSEKCFLLASPEFVLIDTINQEYAVPTFVEELDKLNMLDSTYLTNDFDLYILDFRRGKYIDEELLYNENTYPNEFKHGISKGVAMSKKRETAIYWIEIW